MHVKQKFNTTRTTKQSKGDSQANNNTSKAVGEREGGMCVVEKPVHMFVLLLMLLLYVQHATSVGRFGPTKSKPGIISCIPVYVYVYVCMCVCVCVSYARLYLQNFYLQINITTTITLDGKQKQQHYLTVSARLQRLWLKKKRR